MNGDLGQSGEDRGGRRSAEAVAAGRIRLVDRDENGDARVIGGKVAHERREVRARTVLGHVGAVVLNLVTGPGLSGHRNALDLSAGTGSVAHHVGEEARHDIGGLVGDDTMRFAHRCVPHLTVLVDRRMHQPRWHVGATVRHCVHGGDDLQRGAGESVAVTDGGLLRAAEFVGLSKRTGALAGELQSGCRAESETLQIVVQPLDTDGVGRHHRADVGGLGEDLLDAHRFGRVGIRVLDRVLVRGPLVEREDPRHEEHARRRHRTGIDGRRHAEDLGHRSGFVRFDGCHVAGSDLSDTAPVAPDAGDGQHFTGRRVENDGITTLGRQLLHATQQSLFDLILHRSVDGEHEVGAGSRRFDDATTTRNGATRVVHLAHHETVDATQDLVVLQFEPGRTLTERIGLADHVARQSTRHLNTLRFGDSIDPSQTEREDRFGHVVIDEALDVHEGATAIGQLLGQFGLTDRVDSEHLSEQM